MAGLIVVGTEVARQLQQGYFEQLPSHRQSAARRGFAACAYDFAHGLNS
jgi:hypothetical protein